MLKRSFDVLGSLVLLILTLPAWLVLAILIRSYDGGPALYRQKRIGLRGESFDIFKFRSMIQNADKFGGYSTAQNDVRITPIGRILRRYSLDELPQVLNVLKGDMSVVGPRPDVPAQRVLYSDTDFCKRHSVRPGITGLAQATLRSSATPEERLQLDLEYVDRGSFFLDLKVIALTIRQVVIKGGI